MLSGKVIINSIAGLITKTQHNFTDYTYKMSQYFPKLYESFSGDINVKVDYLIMQQKQISKTLCMLILQASHYKQIW